MDFSERLKDLRLKGGLTQTELASKIGVTYAAIQKYENNIGMPRAKNIELLANYFNVSISYLLGESQSDNLDILFKKIEKLNENQQQQVSEFVDELILNK